MKQLKTWVNAKMAALLIGLTMLWDTVKENANNIKMLVMIFLLTMVVISGFRLATSWRSTTEDTSKPQPIRQVTKVATVGTEVIKPAAVKVYKPEAKRKLNLPQEVQEDKDKAVVSSVKVDYSLKPQAVTTVLDTQTGEATTYVNDEPRPWLDFRDSGSASLAYGIKSGPPVVRLSVTQDLLQIKAVALGGVAHLDSDGDYFVGAGVTYRW